MASFGEQLAAWRDAAGLTQEQVALHVGVRQQTVAGWEVDDNRPAAKRLAVLAEVLGIEKGEIMDAYVSASAQEPPERQPPVTRPVLEHMMVQMLTWQERLSEQMGLVARLVEDVRAELRGRLPTTPPTTPAPPPSQRQRS